MKYNPSNLDSFQLSNHNQPITLSYTIIGGSKGAPGTRAPLGVQILSFSCSFRQKNRLAHPLWELAPQENPGSATDEPNFFQILYQRELLLCYYRPQTKLQKGNVSQACVKNSVHRGEVYTHTPADTPP